jgi:hypothetical protein
MPLHGIDGAGVALEAQRLVQPLRRAPLPRRQRLLNLQPASSVDRNGPSFGIGWRSRRYS